MEHCLRCWWLHPCRFLRLRNLSPRRWVWWCVPCTCNLVPRIQFFLVLGRFRHIGFHLSVWLWLFHYSVTILGWLRWVWTCRPHVWLPLFRVGRWICLAWCHICQVRFLCRCGCNRCRLHIRLWAREQCLWWLLLRFRLRRLFLLVFEDNFWVLSDAVRILVFLWWNVPFVSQRRIVSMCCQFGPRAWFGLDIWVFLLLLWCFRRFLGIDHGIRYL